MAKVAAKVTGGRLNEYEADTVFDLKSEMGLDGNFTVLINGEPAEMSDDLEDHDFVTFTKSVKGGK